MVFRWQADDCSLIVVYGSSLPSSNKKKMKKKKKTLSKLDPPLTKLSGSAHEVASKGCRQQITNVNRTVRIRQLICYSPLQFTYERFSDKYRVNLLGKNSCLLSSADFFFKINFLKNYLRITISVKKFRSRSGPTFCRA